MKDVSNLVPNGYLGNHNSPKKRNIMVGERNLNIADLSRKEDEYTNVLQNYLTKLIDMV